MRSSDWSSDVCSSDLLVTVLDMEGVGLKDLGGEALEFMKQASKIVQEHYVERCHKMFLVNVPYMFSFIWRIVQPMVNENTRRKITIDRKSVGTGKSVSVRVAIGGARIIKKKKK